MHDGSMKTLEEVVRLYETGGAAHRNKDDLIQPFNLSDEERKDLINFMHALTDTSFINYHVNRAKAL
jgi:cytochrome c peroxidase